ncbi:YceI family protein [Sedimentitalea sp. JM2-8]|uniref:YceI family protein n=1 Tax=Sedimentitalea xiamensis TaxID=3050037 RepID=A0ABT7FFX3_9RHOB|nr:YceI family protein [Sedimentitalea xiamensis]MDK3073880.1 YceI family protein [Sedimentitalea xiamensis]
MIRLNRRALVIALGSLTIGRRAAAERTRYLLDAAASSVAFRFSLNGLPQSGSMPVKQADVQIDTRNLANSRVDVWLDVARASTGLVFATQAMIGRDVLDAARFPFIRFRSRSVRLAPDGRLSGGAEIAGDLTLRDVTRPIALNAGLYRPPGSAPDDLRSLTVLLDGQISRSAFGAAGFADLVGDAVTLDIKAVIRAAE